MKKFIIIVSLWSCFVFSAWSQRSVTTNSGKPSGFISFFPDENIAFPGPCYAGGGVAPNNNKSLSYFPTGLGFSCTLSFTGFAFFQNGTFAGWGSSSPDSGPYYKFNLLGLDQSTKSEGWQIMGGPNRVKTDYNDLVYLGISTTCDAPRAAELDLSSNSNFFITVKNNSTANLALNIQLGDRDSLSTNCDNCAFVINSVSQGVFQTYTANFSNKWQCKYGKCVNNLSQTDSTHITGILITPNSGSTVSGEDINFSILNIGVGRPVVSLTFPDFKKSFESINFIATGSGYSYQWPFFIGSAISFEPTILSVTAPGLALSLSSSSGFGTSITLYPNSLTGILTPVPVFLKYESGQRPNTLNTTLKVLQADAGTTLYPINVLVTDLYDELYRNYFSLKYQPVEDEIVLLGTEFLQSAQLISMLGVSKGLEFEQQNGQIILPVRGFQSGWYLLELITPKGIVRKKIVKL
ncbi:MAG: hypothetical protein K2Q22_06525 [Cytophagales bacterium]|nr:hypothetical protein [Cytophagales bacterium]